VRPYAVVPHWPRMAQNHTSHPLRSPSEAVLRTHGILFTNSFLKR
jgi:hypothetical protein